MCKKNVRVILEIVGRPIWIVSLAPQTLADALLGPSDAANLFRDSLAHAQQECRMLPR